MTKKLIRAGEAATINTKSARGHKGRIAKRNKNGKITAITITHAEITNKRKNIPMQENPEKADWRPAFIVKRAHKLTDKNVGRRHPEIVIKNPIDKSVLRKIRSKAIKNKR